MTTNQNPTELHCPTCQKIVFWTSEFPHKPFCSERCKLIDFGDWANEKHRIASGVSNETEGESEEIIEDGE